jgi:hypothetical protein
MKRQNIILLLLTGLFLTVCCHKEKEDYREKWEGDYIGEYIYSFVTTGVYNKDTIRDAVISVIILDDSCLHFIGISREWKVKINTDGYFEQVDDNYGHVFYNGNIRGDSISMLGGTMSPGSSSHESYKGKRYKK